MGSTGYGVKERRARVGVDAGGTFTDICLRDPENGELRIWKVDSTPQDPSKAILAGVEQIVAMVPAADASPISIDYLGHGTTVATNALIELRGAEMGLITTQGYRDLLEIQRQRRPVLYDLQADKAQALIPRDRRLEVSERVLFDGTVASELSEEDVRAVAGRLRELGVKAVAVCFLFSYVEPKHELMVRRILAEELPDVYVSISHEVSPEYREYERLSTTVVNAFVGPGMARYLGRLRSQLGEMGMKSPPHIMQSNGGTISCEIAERQPVRTILSGPAAGVAGAIAVGRRAGVDDFITVDMGGTSTDVALIESGRAQRMSSTVVHGYPLKTSMLGIHTVGAGGGSIAHVDEGGLLKVGPQSAGADPGPMCYNLGGQAPTVTDANVLLRVLNPMHLLGGRMQIDASLSREGVSRLASRVELGVMEAAQGIVDIVVANMVRAIRTISVERGYDPKDFTLMAFGGAGPVHAGRLARALDMSRILIPRYPGILCSLGLLLTDTIRNLSVSSFLPLSDASVPSLAEKFAMLEQQASAWFAEENFPQGVRELERSLDMRYRGQSHELTVSCPPGPITPETIRILTENFEKAHFHAYSYAAQDEPMEITTIRLDAIGKTSFAGIERPPAKIEGGRSSIVDSREVFLPEMGGFVECPIHDRDLLASGSKIEGPAIIDQDGLHDACASGAGRDRRCLPQSPDRKCVT